MEDKINVSWRSEREVQGGREMGKTGEQRRKRRKLQVILTAQQRFGARSEQSLQSQIYNVFYLKIS